MLCFRKFMQFVAALSLLAGLYGCMAQPLYLTGDASKRQSGFINHDLQTRLAAIIIDEVTDRDAQILRNRLVYLLNGGQSQSALSAYQLSLDVSTVVMATVQVDVGDRTDRTGRPSAGMVRGRASYILRDGAGTIVASQQRSTSASFDRPRQEYANLQAQEDAKRQALEELAQQIYLALAQDLVRNNL